MENKKIDYLEEDFYFKILQYVTDFRDMNIPFPWEKIILEAKIAKYNSIDQKPQIKYFDDLDDMVENG